ncbi:MAG: hypothetical protein JRG91_00280 [Deltaproteobacteria bacterium]|nr:hypothetical protein [Deltaproteobacteria bacterium]
MLLEALRDCARRPGFWLWSIAQVAGAVVCAAVAISARPGYESSLVLAPVAALAAGMIAAGTVVRLRREASPVAFSALVLRVLAAIAPGLVASLAVLLAAGSVRGLCDPLQGLGFFIMGPVCSALASAALASVIALALPGRRTAFAVLAAVLAASLAWDGALLYYTPQVFVFDHLLGFFGGPLYDEAVGLQWRHVVFRLITAGRIAPMLLLAAALHDPDRLRLDTSRLSRRTARAALSAWLIVLTGTFLAEPTLALRASQAEIGRRLGGQRMTRHLIIHHPAELDDAQVSFLEAEAELRWRELEAFFGGGPERRLSLYFFRSAAEMRRLTGTGPTNVAKPWLGAAFMVYSRPPNRVLKHEMAHLFGATWGRGPLRMPGKLMGILADPLILEGTAVAADWSGDPLDPHMRSAAILEAGLVENPASLEGIVGFYTHQGGLAYVMSGSFVRFLWSNHGPQSLAAWYAGGSFEEAFGTTRSEAYEAWVDHLEDLSVPRPWLTALERRYASPSLFGRPCPHQVALLLGEAALVRAQGDADLSGEILDRVCDIAPEDNALKILRLRHLVSTGMLERARTQVNGLMADTAALGGFYPMVLELAGDVAWLEGDGAAATRSYSLARGLSAEDGPVRMLTVKLWASSHHEAGHDVLEYLIRGPVEPGGAVERLERIADRTDEPMVHYLLGRARFNAARWNEAASSLERALEGPLAAPILKGEALRLLAAALLWAGERRASLVASRTLENLPPPTPALGYHARELRALAEAVK